MAMWPFNRKAKAPEAPQELTPFDTQVLTLIELAPDACQVGENTLIVPKIGQFNIVPGGMQFFSGGAVSTRTRRLSPRGMREVAAKHQEILDSAQPEEDSVTPTVDPAGAKASAITALDMRVTASEVAMRQQEYMLRQQQLQRGVSWAAESGLTAAEYYRTMQQAGYPPDQIRSALQNNLYAFGGSVAPAPPDQL
jgi:hypothetical protein